MAIAFPLLPWYSDEMDKILRNGIRGFKSQISIQNTEDVISLFKLIESRNTEMSQEFSYSAGQVLWEYFIGTYGFKKWIEFNINIPKPLTSAKTYNTQLELIRRASTKLPRLTS